MTDRELIAELERVNAALERDRDSAREASRFGSQRGGLPNALASPYRAHGGQPLPVYPSSAFTARIAELEREVAVTEHRRDRAVEQKEDAERVAEDARNDRDDARDRLEAAEAQIATFTRERDEAWMALEACRETCMEAEGYRDRAETAERERDEAVQGRARESERIIELEGDLLSVHDALHAACAPDHPADLPGEIWTLRAERDRLREADRERNRFWGALHRIGYESIGDAEASTDEVLDIITARARAALAPQAEKED